MKYTLILDNFNKENIKLIKFETFKELKEYRNNMEYGFTMKRINEETYKRYTILLMQKNDNQRKKAGL